MGVIQIKWKADHASPVRGSAEHKIEMRNRKITKQLQGRMKPPDEAIIEKWRRK